MLCKRIEGRRTVTEEGCPPHNVGVMLRLLLPVRPQLQDQPKRQPSRRLKHQLNHTHYQTLSRKNLLQRPPDTQAISIPSINANTQFTTNANTRSGATANSHPKRRVSLQLKPSRTPTRNNVQTPESICHSFILPVGRNLPQNLAPIDPPLNHSLNHRMNHLYPLKHTSGDRPHKNTFPDPDSNQVSESLRFDHHHLCQWCQRHQQFTRKFITPASNFEHLRSFPLSH